MSLGVKLDHVKGPGPPGERLARVTFRGVSRVSRLFQHTGDVSKINQLLEWPIARGINGDEKLEIQILAHNKFLSNRVICHVCFSLHRLLDESCIQLAASLLDNTDKPTKAILHVVVWYSGPGQYNNHDNGLEIDMEEDNQALINLERNIANLERSMSTSQLGLGTGGGRGDLSSILNRQHGSNQSLNTVGGNTPVSRTKYHTTQEVVKKKNISLKSVKNALTFGRRRSHSASEEQNLLGSSLDHTDKDTEDEAGAGGIESQDETDNVISGRSRRDSGTSFLSDNQSLRSGHVQETKKPKKSKKSKSSNSWHNTLKAQDYQVCITVIEARQLAGLNMDPVVCVQVGDTKKWTSVKESTNCPYYNEYFVFDFHMAPVMLFDKIISFAVQHRQLLRPGIVLGSFKLDIATVMAQQDHQFYHKWALLTDPDDISGGVKGYLKCDISVITKGDAIKIPPKSERDEDDIEANLLVPVGVTSNRQRAKFIVRIYRADGLPRMNSSIMSNLKHAFGAQTRDLVNPYVQVSFAGLTGRTTVKRNSYNPIWNEQIVFTEMFPPLCQRVKIQLKESDTVGDTVIGTHYIDFSTISNDGDKGYLPTFGPAFVHLYGSTRDFSFIDEHSTLNDGMGEGVSYRGQLLVAIKTEISDSIDTAPSEVEVEQTQTINEAVYNKNEDFFLFGSIMDATMIDKKLTDKPISFEISLGNAGNSLDGQTQAGSATQNEDDEDTLKATWHSTTPPMKPLSHDRLYYFLPMWDDKPCLYIRALQPDHRRRMYASNAMAKIVDKLEESLHEVHNMLECDCDDADVKLKETFETLYHQCSNFSLLCSTPNTGLSMTGKTRLDKERLTQCQRELETIGAQAKQWKSLTNRATVKEKYKGAQGFLERIKCLVEDPQHALPDIFLWMISGQRRVAYHRIPARTILYSMIDEECGHDCGITQTVFLKLPGKRGLGSGGWQIQAKIQVYLWLGLIKHKKCYPSGLPPGFKLTEEILNAEKPTLPPPVNIHYNEKHYFQVRAYVYQARSLIGSDDSGLSDPFARVIIGEYCKTSQVIEETLSPTWDESMIFEEVLVYGRREDIKANPPIIIVETYDQDKVGKAEFLGRATAKPHVYLEEDVNYSYPKLEWFQIYRGNEDAGELLAAFEMFELGDSNRPLPPPPPIKNESNQTTGPIMPIPPEIRPTLVKYRFEVLFWGLRDLKRVQFLTVDKPRVDVECGGHIIQSTVIQDANKNPNFSQNVRYLDVELPEQEMYCPPLSIRVVDCRSFGRFTLVGSHTSPSIHKYLYHPITGEIREEMNRKRAQSLIRNAQESNFNFDYFVSTDGVSPTSSPWHKSKETLISIEHGTYIAVDTVPEKAPGTDNEDDDEECMDWWTKYFASIDTMIEEGRSNRGDSFAVPPLDKDKEKKKKSLTAFKSVTQVTKAWGNRLSPKVEKKKVKSKVALMKVYPNELECQPEFDGFSEWLQTFDLYRGKKSDEDFEDENRVVGRFKGAIKIYKLPLPKDLDDYTVMGNDPRQGFFQGLPSNEPLRVLVRVYVVKANDLHPMDINGKADPYLVLQLGSKRVTDKDNYVSKQLNPVFGKCFEMDASFPQDSVLTVQVYDWDLLGGDDLIGETKVDLENRFYSRHRSTCGLAAKYDPCGYNEWRDPMKPSQILAKLCKEGKIDGPHFCKNKVTVGDKVFTANNFKGLPESPSSTKIQEEQLALGVLHHWDQVARVGYHLVPEHVETRALYNPDKPGIEQGKVEMWVDMFPMDMPPPKFQVDISPRKPTSWELRVIVWNTDEVVLEDDAFFSGDKMSDIYVKGWLTGPEDSQATDVHYRSLTGEGNFNWRFLFPFEYLAAEEKIVISKKESMFSWDDSITKVPPRLSLQVWDADSFSKDDFLGSIVLDLNKFPRGAKTAKQCNLDMLKTDGTVPTLNLFKQKRTKGWWPMYAKDENDELILQGKVEAELILMTNDEAEKSPAGLGREEPNALEKPTRPDSSFMWFLNPIKSIRYIIWHNYKWTILKILFFIFLTLFIALFFYSLPGYTIKKMLGA